MRLRFVAVLMAFFAATGLSACATPDPVTKFPDLRYVHKGDITLQVGAVDIASQYEAPLKDPNVEHLFPVPPERAARNWAEDRLKATGVGGFTARFVILDASAVMEKIKTQKGLTGFVTNEQAEKYTVNLDVALEIRDAQRRVVAQTTAKSSISRTVAEDAC